MKEVSVSILNGENPLKSTETLNNTSADYIHLDVMDGKFVIGITPQRYYLNTSIKPLQVHLMVSDPFNYINKYGLANTESIIIQVELDEDINGLLNFIKSKKIKCGLAIKPETNIDRITPYIDMLDYVLVLTVEPGRGGQKMIDDVLSKIDELNEYKIKNGLNYEIIVDGGVNSETIDKVRNADIVVSGSYICENDDYQSQIDKLKL
jgi:ribulose-phosphate 3-epimerase